MTFLAKNPATNHLEFTDLADLSTGQYAPGAQWIGQTAHITSAAVNPAERDTLYKCVLDGTTGLHKWLQQLTMAAAVLPDQRFTVGKDPYKLTDPGVSTLLSLTAGIAAALAGTGTTLGAPTLASQRLVELQPDTYAASDVGESVALTVPSFIHYRGMGPTPAANVLSGFTFNYTAAGVGEVVFENIAFNTCDFNWLPGTAPTGVGTVSARFINCTFVGCKEQSTTNGGTIDLKFIDCSDSSIAAGFASSSAAVADVLNKTFTGNGGTAGVASGSDGLSFAVQQSFSGNGSVDLRIEGGQRLSVDGVQSLATFGGNLGVAITTEDCLLSNGGASVWEGTAGAQITWQMGVGSKIDTTPLSYFNVTTSGRVLCGQLEILTPITVLGAAPLNPISGGNADSTAHPSNWIHRSKAFGTFNVPAVPMAAVNNATVGIASPFEFDAYADEFRLTANYSTGGGAINPDTSLLATFFRYALLQLPDAALLEDGRWYTIKNTGDPSSTTDGPFALRLPNGTASRVDYFQSDVTVNAIITSVNYVILAPGDSVKLSVDRSNGGTPRYLLVG